MSDKISVFLSHSHKDIEKVRRIRNVLESLYCDPLMFYLISMDDDEQLAQLIKNEIDERKIFVYCKSQNAEKSKWVREELEHIKKTDLSRLYTIDIDDAFEIGLASFIAEIARILKNNSIIIYHAKDAKPLPYLLGYRLEDLGFRVYYQEAKVIDPSKELQIHDKYYYSDIENTKVQKQYELYFKEKIVPTYEELCSNGIFIPILSDGLFEGEWPYYLISRCVRWFNNTRKHIVLPVAVGSFQLIQTKDKNKIMVLQKDNDSIDRIVQEIIRLSAKK